MINEEALKAILLALAERSDDDVERAITNSDALDDDDRKLIRTALDSADTAAGMARALGDAVRAAGNIDYLSNECYRAAFYLGDGIADVREDPLFGFFSSKRTGRILDKWIHYFPVYSEHFSRFRGRPVRILEIGVYRGGSLDMWRWYFGPDAVIVGADIDERAREVAAPDHVVEIGDQTDPEFLRSLSEKYGPFDIVIDDGGHEMQQQIVTAETLFPLIADGGVLLTEDCHTSYWEGYQGGRGRAGTFIEWCKERADDVNGYHQDRPIDRTWTDTLASVAFYDSIVVLKKQQRFAPFAEQVGHAEFLLLPRLSAQYVTELAARRDAAVAERDELRRQQALDRQTIAELTARANATAAEQVRGVARSAADRLGKLRRG
ncbi:class I SAM-dependent methyltransferase [Blastococcus litoris]|uniref:class I SAM-dependent methyltransferase n=1 Tax=Blastococcus litoris TaxID=2171622 RepID=UPI000E2FFADA|nr:class I SAM-dependent methyltransferase [Blastococcus litoris]